VKHSEPIVSARKQWQPEELEIIYLSENRSRKPHYNDIGAGSGI